MQRHTQSGAICVGTVVDSDDDDGVVGVVDAQQDPVVTAAGAVEASEVVAQRFAEPVRVLGEGSGDELDDGVDDPGWKALKVAASWGCEKERRKFYEVASSEEGEVAAATYLETCETPERIAVL